MLAGSTTSKECKTVLSSATMIYSMFSTQREFCPWFVFFLCFGNVKIFFRVRSGDNGTVFFNLISHYMNTAICKKNSYSLCTIQLHAQVHRWVKWIIAYSLATESYFPQQHNAETERLIPAFKMHMNYFFSYFLSPRRYKRIFLNHRLTELYYNFYIFQC